MKDLVFFEKPELHNPRMIIGLDGWPNAGKVSTNVVLYLIRKLRARKFAEIKPDNFYVLSSTRPQTVIKEGEVKDFNLPSSDFYYWKDEETSKDLIFLLAGEPDLRWNEYADLVFQLAKQYLVKRIFTIGGVADYVTHTTEPRVSVVVSDPGLRAELENYPIAFIDYQGPASFHTFLHSQKDIEVISLWGTVPIYLTQNPKAYYYVLKILVPMLELDVALEDMRNAGERIEKEVNELMGQNPQLKEFVDNLERSYKDKLKPAQADIESLMREIEEFLRRQKRRET